MPGLLEDIKTLIRTRHAIVTINTVDEQYAVRLIVRAAEEMGMGILEWAVGQRLRPVTVPDAKGVSGTEKLMSALMHMQISQGSYVYVLKDAMKYLSDPATERLLREVGQIFCGDQRTVFMIDAGGQLPESVRHLAVPFELAMPDEDEIDQLVKDSVRELSSSGKYKLNISKDDYRKFISNLRGLSRGEISQVVAEAVLGDKCLDRDDIAGVIDFKRRNLQKTGVLDYIPPPEQCPKVGGISNLRRWLKLREKALLPEARKFGLEMPRGILLLGVQGCGKSLMARYVAASWSMPLLRMDVGSLYDKYIGESERHLRQAFQTASGMAPCVLWIDEIEKAFASTGSGAAGAASDGGLGQRMFGQLLTWMQDRRDPVFLVATANNIDALPPELMRKGRFDEIFFVDLPSAEAREDIFGIHLSKRGRNAGNYDLVHLSEISEGFSGSEIEQAVVSAMYAAFAEGRDITTEDIANEIKSTSPLSVVMGEKIAAIRQWAQDRCVKAD